MTTLEKIRAEIEQYSLLTRERAIRIIDKYAEQECDNDCNTCKYGDWKRNGLDITMADDKCGGCCSWKDKYEPIECDAVSRQAVLDLIEHYNSDGLGSVFYGYEQGVKFANAVNKLPPVRPQEQTGKWIDYSDEGYVECPFCGHATNCEDNIDELHFCFWCGAKMVEPQEKRCADCNHYGKLSLDCSRCDDDCSMYEPQESEDKE